MSRAIQRQVEWLAITLPGLSIQAFHFCYRRIANKVQGQVQIVIRNQPAFMLI
jgi:hypothetical protein